MYADGGDFRPGPGSPCIDAGASDGAPTEDINGIPRWDDPYVPNSGGGAYPYYDIGAHEYVVSYFYVSGADGFDTHDGLAPV